MPRQRERYGGRLAVPRQRDERLANPEERGRGRPRLALPSVFLRAFRRATHRKPTPANVKTFCDGRPILLK